MAKRKRTEEQATIYKT